jgi:hypothetical protein
MALSIPINASSIYIPNIQFQLENRCTVLLINTAAEQSLYWGDHEIHAKCFFGNNLKRDCVGEYGAHVK